MNAGIERRRGERRKAVRVRLIRKLADQLDGIDLSNYRVGDVFDLPQHDAAILTREGWAVRFDQTPENA